MKIVDINLDHIVAIKLLPHDKIADPERKERFFQEARSASTLNHPNIITIHDIVSEEERDFMVMEYVNGKTLSDMIWRKGLEVNQALRYTVQIVDGMAKAHSAGIIHRYLKPPNIMETDEGLGLMHTYSGRIDAGACPLRLTSNNMPITN